MDKGVFTIIKRISNVSLLFLILFMITINVQAQEIFEAIRNGEIGKVKELVEKDPELVKARNARQSTPLHVAIDSDNESSARYLIEKGADVNALNRNKWTPLFYAKTIGAARLLVEKGAEINTGMPIAWMLATRRKEVAEYLLDMGAQLPEIGTTQGRLFLIRSLRSGSSRFLEKYLQQGFDPLYENTIKNNLLHFASESNSAELIDQLIGLGVPANKTNIFGWTPLHTAAAYGNLQAVKALLKEDTDVNACTNDGKTSYNLAVEAKKDEAAEYLKSIGVDQSPQRFPVLTGDYMGQKEPGKKAVPFAPGILSPQHSYHGAITFTADGNEMYWSASGDSADVSILYTKRENGKWREPEIFSRGDVPFICPDGNRLYFVISKQVQGGTKEVICIREKIDARWSEPKELPEIINSVPGLHWQVSVDGKGNLYFGTFGESGCRIYYSKFKEGEYGKPQIIESLKDMNAFSPYIAPDGSYLIITKGEGDHDLILLFRKGDGSWTKGIELADYIGVKGAFCPMVTHDGRYLFFICGVDGNYLHYWVDASFIEEMRPEEPKEY